MHQLSLQSLWQLNDENTYKKFSPLTRPQDDLQDPNVILILRESRNLDPEWVGCNAMLNGTNHPWRPTWFQKWMLFRQIWSKEDKAAGREREREAGWVLKTADSIKLLTNFEKC